MYWFRELPKSMKWLIVLVITSLILLTTNFIFYKIATKEEPFNTMAYYIYMTGFNEQEIKDKFKKMDSEFKEVTLEEASTNVNKLLEVPKELDTEINDLFENKNKRIIDLENLETYNALIVSYGVDGGISDNDLSIAIQKYKKENNGKVYAFSDRGIDGSQIYYKLGLRKYKYDNKLDEYQNIDKRYENNRFDTTHVFPEQEYDFPQFFVIENGAINFEKTNSLYIKDMVFLNLKGDISYIGDDYFEKNKK